MAIWKIGAFLLATLLAYEFIIQGTEIWERHSYWKASRHYCNQVNKKLLRIGIKRSFTEPPNGDVTLDLDKEILKIPGGVQGDERAMPFHDKQFGVCFNEHTLEHLHSAEDVQQAVKECTRVADCAVFLMPSPYSIWSTFFCETHRLRLWEENNTLIVEEMGLTPVGRVIVAYEPPLVFQAKGNRPLQVIISAMGGRPKQKYEMS